jgi:hypothetical protein
MIIARCLGKRPDRLVPIDGRPAVALLDHKEDTESGRTVITPPPRQPCARGGNDGSHRRTSGGPTASPWLLLRPKLVRQMAVSNRSTDSGLTAFPAISLDGITAGLCLNSQISIIGRRICRLGTNQRSSRRQPLTATRHALGGQQAVIFFSKGDGYRCV